jgi:hypothetical protein
VASTKIADKPSIDWADVHRRLDRLGAISFHQQKLMDGGFQVTFLLPSEQPHRAHQVEAKADSADQAVALALERAEQLAKQK